MGVTFVDVDEGDTYSVHSDGLTQDGDVEDLLGAPPESQRGGGVETGQSVVSMQFGQDAIIELVQADARLTVIRQVVGGKSRLDDLIERRAHPRMQAQCSQIRAPREEIHEGEPGAGGVGATTAHPVGRGSMRWFEQGRDPAPEGPVRIDGGRAAESR